MPPLDDAQLLPARFSQAREVRHSLGGAAFQSLIFAWRLPDLIEQDRLRTALEALVDRHEILRTSFHEVAGDIVQAVAPSTELPCATAATIDETVLELFDVPFVLGTAPLFRIRLIAPEHLLVLTVAHTVWDAASTFVFIRDLDAIYQSSEAALPKLAIQFGDFAAFERSGEPRSSATAYWRDRLAGYEPRLSLPAAGTDRSGPYESGEHTFEAASAHVMRSLQRLAQRERTTLNLIVLAGFVAVLQPAAPGTELTVAVADANRQRPELRDLLGYTVAVNLIRVDVSDHPTFNGLVREIHAATAEAYANELPVERQVTKPADLVNHPAPLCDAFFNFVPAEASAAQPRVPGTQRFPPEQIPIEWAKFPSRSSPWGVQIDLELWSRPSGGISAVLSHNRTTVPAADARALASTFAAILEAVSVGQNPTGNIAASVRWNWRATRGVKQEGGRSGKSKEPRART